MKPHKWAKEIKAWADGAEIECNFYGDEGWTPVDKEIAPVFSERHQYRIKPQPKENEFAHIPYWLCCGSLDPHHHKTFCSEAKAGYPERCRFGTITEHQKRMKKPQPKEPQYLYVYARNGEVVSMYDAPRGWSEDYIGKIKLEIDDE